MNKEKYKNGIIVGRFQPFHLEHMRFAEIAASKTKHLWVGITRPFGSFIPEIGSARTTDGANPLPYWLRFKCVEAALGQDALIPRDAFSVIPAPLSPEILKTIVPKGTVFMTTILDGWSLQKEELFIQAGFEVERIEFEYKPISATIIREKIKKGDDSWKEMVPRSIGKQYCLEIESYVRMSV